VKVLGETRVQQGRTGASLHKHAAYRARNLRDRQTSSPRGLREMILGPWSMGRGDAAYSGDSVGIDEAMVYQVSNELDVGTSSAAPGHG